MKRITIIFTVFMVLFLLSGTCVHGAYTADQIRIFTFAEKLVRGIFYLRLQVVIPDMVQGFQPLFYFGQSFNLNIKGNKLKLSAMLGKLFVEDEQMKVAFLASYNTKRWYFCSQLDYNINKDKFWQIIQVRYKIPKIKDFWVGLESENIYGEYTSFGLNIGVKMNEMVSLSLTFFQKFHNDDSYGFLRAYLIWKLD